MLLFKNIFIIFLCVFSILFYVYYKKSTNTFYKNVLIYSFGIYVLILLGITLFPLPIQAEEIAVNIKYNLGLKNNYIPFINTYKDLISDYNHGLIFASLKQIIGNILIFIPIGIYMPYFIKKINLKKIIIIGIFSSLMIELTQLFINTILTYNYRSVDVDDLILNTIGTIVGYFLFKILYKKFDNLINS